MRTGLQNCRTRRTLCTAVFDSILKNCFCLCAPWSVSRQNVNLSPNRRPVRITGVQKRTQGGFSVPSHTQTAQFCSPKINACEIRKDFRRRSNALYRPVIYRSVKPLHRTAAYSAASYVLMQNGEACRVLLRTGHRGRKSERICGTADFHCNAHTVHLLKTNITKIWR